MLIDSAFLAATVASAVVLWLILAVSRRRLVNPAWVVVAVLLGHQLAVLAGGRIAELVSSVVGPMVIVCLIAFPVVLRSPRLLAEVVRDSGVRLWIAFFLFGALSLLWSNNREYGAEKLLVAGAAGMVPGMVAYVAYRYRGRVVWDSLLLIGTAYAAVVLLQGEATAGRLSTEDGNPIWIARAVLLVVTVGLWSRRSPLLLRIPAVLSGLWVAVATQSRGPLLACIAAPFILKSISLASKKERKYRWTSVSLTAAGVAVVLSTLVVLPPQPSFPSPDSSRLTLLLRPSELERDANITTRLALQGEAFDRFVKHPILGGGLGSGAPEGERLYPHNVPLELASEMGIVGLGLWLVAIGAGFRAARNYRIAQLLLLQVLLYSITSGDLGANSFVVLFAIFSRAFPVQSQHRLDIRAPELGPAGASLGAAAGLYDTASERTVPVQPQL